MPVTVVVGGQYGSEGKGKVAHYLARERDAAAVIRVGGPNSGHTSFAKDGSRQVLQQLPVAALLDDSVCLLGPGAYVDPEILLSEISRLNLGPERVCVDYRAFVVTDADKQAERDSGLGDRIGSTCSGTGAAVVRRIGRAADGDLAFGCEDLHPFVGDSVAFARRLLDRRRRVVVEGTQGFGLSLLHSPHYPYVTSRDTSAAAPVAEAGLSPLDVDEVAMVLRAFPIRVAGSSGPFDAEEIEWETIAQEAGLPKPPQELTSVTRRLRRVARFEPEIVIKAIRANRPSLLVLNHLDHVDGNCAGGTITEKAQRFIAGVENATGHGIDLVGFGPRPGDLVRPRQSAALETG
ncbi:MAG TPA: adenylosuccinate synthetase [Solirubrobacterales bacterium]|nr:adenylosuccinate synthetase [Solirubrobacterales bacterium]